MMTYQEQVTAVLARREALAEMELDADTPVHTAQWVAEQEKVLDEMERLGVQSG